MQLIKMTLFSVHKLLTSFNNAIHTTYSVMFKSCDNYANCFMRCMNNVERSRTIVNEKILDIFQLFFFFFIQFHSIFYINAMR